MNNVLNVLSDVESLIEQSIPGMKVFKHFKDSTWTDEYMLLNYEPLTFGDVVGSGVVKVDVHIPELAGGKHNHERLQEVCVDLIGIFPDDTFLNGYYVDVRSVSGTEAGEDGTHFITIELSITYNNLETV